jgi:hypothetical protein
MSWIDGLKNLFSSKTPPAPPSSARRPITGKRARASVNSSGELPFVSTLNIVPPPDADSEWRTLDLDASTLSTMSPADLVAYLVDLSPEISRALFDFIRMFNSGWECNAYRLNSERAERRGQEAVDAFLAQLEQLYGSVDVVLNRLVLAGFLRGAFFAEIVLDDVGRLPVDLATPDPYSARFRKVVDPVRGTIYQLGQFQARGWVDLTSPTISYIPIDPLPNSPYGRSLVSPAIFISIFILGMLHDLRRVVQQQGYPRLDLAVEMEKLLEMTPEDITLGTEQFKNWVDAIITEIGDVYGSLEPDDAYVHTDVVAVNRPVGTVDASSLGAVDGLIVALERMITRALKTMPLLMGLQEGGSETHANRQWELHAAGIKSIQHLLESLLQRLLTVMLQAQGIQARVEFRFAELRASEELRDQQTLQLKITNGQALYDAGIIGQEEFAMMTVGHAPEEEEPRRQPAPPEPVQGDGDGEPVADDETRGVTPARELLERSMGGDNGHTT